MRGSGIVGPGKKGRESEEVARPGGGGKMVFVTIKHNYNSSLRTHTR